MASATSIRRKSPLPQNHSGFAVRHGDSIRWRKPCSPLPCPLIKSSFGFALQDSCPSRRLGHRGGGPLRRQEKDVRTAGPYKPVVLLQLPQIQDRTPETTGAPVPKLARGWKDFSASITTDDQDAVG
ncbi:MAG: hypothetical protein ACLT2T_10165 [Bilophila wadsworthia]